MKPLRRIFGSSLPFALLAATALSAAAFACSSDDTADLPDAATPDSGTPDSGTPDTSVPIDSGDSSVDSGTPLGPDASADEVAAVINTFISDQAEAFCGALNTACGAPAAWNGGKCKSIYLSGFANLYEDFLTLGVAKSGHLAFSQADADRCLASIAAIPMPTRTAAQHAAVVDACKNVITGKQPVGGACASNVECAPGNVCKNIKNGAGACAAIDAAGASCEYPTATKRRSNTCSYHGNGETGRFCSDTTNVSGKCVAFQAAGTACTFDTQCASNLCGPNADSTTTICVDTYNELATNDTCAYFTAP